MSNDTMLDINRLIRDDVGHGDDVEDDDGTETLTAAEVYARMEVAWINEKLSPEMLPHATDVVECMMEQLTSMQQNLTSRSRRNDLKCCIHRMETERIRYILSDYYRTRLQKIESSASTLLNPHVNQSDSSHSDPTSLQATPTSHASSMAARLTNEELSYARDYQAALDSHLHGVALRHMPLNLQSMHESGAGPRTTAQDRHVFLRVVRDVEGAVVEEETEEAREEVIDLRVGDQHIMRYRPIAGLIDSGDLALI